MAEVHVTSCTNTDLCGFLSLQYVKLADMTVRKLNEADSVWVFDYVLEPTFSNFNQRMLHFSSAPLTIEQGLQSLVWPLHANVFKNQVYNQRGLVVHTAQNRLDTLFEDLDRFDVEKMISNASRAIVSMATKQRLPKDNKILILVVVCNT